MISTSRLDHFLVLEEWQDHFSNLNQSAIPKPTSNHSLIILDGDRLSKAKTPFRFEDMWLKMEGFKDLIKRWWSGYSLSGSCSHILVEKLNALK